MEDFSQRIELEYRMATFCRLRHKTLWRYFQSIGLFNGNPAMLFHIGKTPGLTQKELAEQMDISPACVAISVKRLIGAGMVERRRDDKDGRIVHLFLTEKGRQMDVACSHGRDFMVQSLYDGLSGEELRQLYGLLGRMTENMQKAMETLPEPAEKERIE